MTGAEALNLVGTDVSPPFAAENDIVSPFLAIRPFIVDLQHVLFCGSVFIPNNVLKKKLDVARIATMHGIIG